MSRFTSEAAEAAAQQAADPENKRPITPVRCLEPVASYLPFSVDTEKGESKPRNGASYPGLWFVDMGSRHAAKLLMQAAGTSGGLPLQFEFEADVWDARVSEAQLEFDAIAPEYERRPRR